VVGMARPESCQPPEMRAAVPREAQFVPSVERSKVARQISVLVPERSQVMVELFEGEALGGG